MPFFPVFCAPDRNIDYYLVEWLLIMPTAMHSTLCIIKILERVCKRLFVSTIQGFRPKNDEDRMWSRVVKQNFFNTVEICFTGAMCSCSDFERQLMNDFRASEKIKFFSVRWCGTLMVTSFSADYLIVSNYRIVPSRMFLFVMLCIRIDIRQC